MDGYIGMILLWPINWAPQDWLLCAGQTLQVSQYQALFSIIGYTYGGSGTQFMLPDLRGRIPVGSGSGPNLTPRQLGSKGGAESASINTAATGSISIGINNLPAHTHAATLSGLTLGSTAQTTMSVSTGANGTVTAPANCQLSTSPSGGPSAGIFLDASATPTTPSTMKGFTTTVNVTGTGNLTVANTGNGQPIPIALPIQTTVATMSPFTCVNFIICTNGLYPENPN